MKRMNELKPLEKAVINEIPLSVPLRRRFWDLGLIENTEIQFLRESPLGDPKAYLIRGTVIAIRSDDCKDITVREVML